MFGAFRGRTDIKFMLGYLAIALIIFAIGILAAIGLNQISVAVSNLTNNLAADMALSKEMTNRILSARLSADKYIRTQDQTDLDNFQQEFSKLEALLAQANRQIAASGGVEMLNRISTAVYDYGNTFNKVSELLKERHRIQSEILDVQGLIIESKLTALRIQVISLNEPLAFLAISNAHNAFQLMRLNSAEYIAKGDERYSILFESSYRQAQDSFSSLQPILQGSAQQKNLTDAQAAAERYHKGFQAVHAGHIELKNTLETKLDALELEIGNSASAIVTNIEREFAMGNKVSQRLILQTRFVLLTTTAFALLAGLALTNIFTRRITERERAALALREANDRLEARVKERTAELTQTNEQLYQEITERVQTEQALQSKNEQLQVVLAEVKQLSGLLPICANCKKIRDDTGYWHQIEVYIHEHSGADFSHGICPECKVKLYPEIFGNKNQQ